MLFGGGAALVKIRELEFYCAKQSTACLQLWSVGCHEGHAEAYKSP